MRNLDIKIPSTAVNAPYSDIPVTEEEIRKRQVRLKLLEEIGASCTKFDGGNETENPYRVQALIYIMQDKEVPEDLKKKIKEFDKKYNIRRK